MLKYLLVFIKSWITSTNTSSTHLGCNPKHTLFVCKSCHRSSEERQKNLPCDGTILLKQLNTLCSEKFQFDELEIKPIECLWACSQGCVVSVSSHDKPTYLFVNLPLEKSPTALLEFMQLYIKSRKGTVAWKQFPGLLQSAIFAQIPPVVVDKNPK
jgi:predicted metal-binding protein